MPDKTYTCTGCGTKLAETSANFRFIRGYRADRVCRRCLNAKNRSTYVKNSEYERDRAKQWRLRNPEAQAHRSWANALRRKYALTPEQYASMLESQCLVCAICKRQDSGYSNGKFCVDHDHDSGKIRGLLCLSCNTMLGMAQDSKCVLSAAIMYLEENETNKHGVQS